MVMTLTPAPPPDVQTKKKSIRQINIFTEKNSIQPMVHFQTGSILQSSLWGWTHSKFSEQHFPLFCWVFSPLAKQVFCLYFPFIDQTLSVFEGEVPAAALVGTPQGSRGLSWDILAMAGYISLFDLGESQDDVEVEYNRLHHYWVGEIMRW